jgi:hypothetical protein
VHIVGSQLPTIITNACVSLVVAALGAGVAFFVAW